MKKTKIYFKIVLMLVTAFLILAFPLNAYAAKVIEKNGVTITKISNPDAGQREVDGLINGGDRENTYTWRLAERAVTFGDNVYFGSYTANPSGEQFILKLDEDGEFTKVYATKGAISLRANCVYDDHLFFAGTGEREVVEDDDGTPIKMAVLQKSNEDDAIWTRVADY